MGPRAEAARRPERARRARAPRARRPRRAGGRAPAPLCRPRRRRETALALEPAGGANLAAQLLELRSRLGELALRLGDGALALGAGRRANSLDLGDELALAVLGGAQCGLDRGALLLGLRPSVTRRLLRRFRLGQERFDAESLGRDAGPGVSTSCDGIPNRSAIWSACDVPGRPTVTR